MSERDPDAILEANVERLMGRSQARPKVPADARARMLATLQRAQATSAVDAETREPADEPTNARPHAPPPAANTPPSRLRRWTPALVLTAVAAALLLAWVLGLGERLLGGPGDRDGQRLALYEHPELGAREYTLADGSRALLRSGSTLEALGPRHLRLTGGEVLLDVVEAGEPLLIETAHGRALVTGTRLLVRASSNDTLTAVLRGSATLQRGQAGELLLHAGEQALIDASGATERILGRRLTHEIDWARDLLAPGERPEPIRRGNLLARVPRWTGQLGPSPEWPLAVRKMVVDVHVEDGHVRTTIDQTFFNHVNRQLEGVYSFPLPPNAAISRLAMYVDETRMEAGVVERSRGRDIYEQIVHRRRDPALLEWMQGNVFRVRIFPLPARTEKRVLLSYTQTLDSLYGDAELRVPIPEIDLPVGEVEYRVRVVGGAGQAFESRNHAFDVVEDGGDLIATFHDREHAIGADIAARIGERDADQPVRVHRTVDDGHTYLAAQVRPDLSALLPAALDAPARDIAVLFDTSASRDPAALDAQRRFLLALVDHLDDDDRIAVQAFDSRARWFAPELQRVRTLDRDALAEFLARESAIGLGTTDLGAAIDRGAAVIADAPPGPSRRQRLGYLLYLGDGLDHAPLTSAETRRLAERPTGEARFAAVSFGEARDATQLDALASAGEGLHLHVDTGDSLPWRALELLTTLSRPRLLDLEAELVDRDGRVLAEATTHVDRRALAEGEALELLTRLPAGTDATQVAALELRGRAATAYIGEPSAWAQRYELPEARDADARWLPRAWAQAQVATLTELGVEAHASEITALGLEHFLVTPTTSLLVLETEKMYRQFEVHRPPEDAWARYDAPDTIEVVRESTAEVDAGPGQYVVRTPIPVLVQYGSTNRQRGFGARASAGEAFGLSGLGLIGSGRGGGGTGGFGFGLGNRPRDEGKLGKLKSLDSTKPTVPQAAAESNFRGFVTTGSPAQNANWSNTSLEQQARFSGPLHSIVDVPNTRFMADLGADEDAGWEYRGGGRPWPQALHYAWDPRLDDLGELAPALFEDAFDLERERLLITGLDVAGGSMSPEARELIEGARAAQAGHRFTLPDGADLRIDGRGRFSVTAERWGFLDERVVYDGEQLRADYPELGLSVVRAVGPTSPALFAGWVPWMVPEADHLARFYDVDRSGDHILRLVPIAGDADEASGTEPETALHVDFDAQLRVTALRVIEGTTERSATRFIWTDEGVTIDRNGRETVIERAAGPTSLDSLGAPQDTRVDLPLPSPVDLGERLDDHEPGSPAWIGLQQQRLAGLAALGHHAESVQVLDALHEHTGRVTRGELVLAGGATQYLSAKQLDAVLSAAPEDDPVAAYLRAGVQARSRGPAGLRKLVARRELEGTPVHFMASYRALLHAIQRGRPSAAAAKDLERFVTRYHHPTFGYIATSQLTGYWWSSPTRRADAWLDLAEHSPSWKYLALHEAGVAYYNAGKYADAAKVFRRSFDEAREDDTLPVVDWTVQYALTQAVGEVGWQLEWSRLRERTAKSGDPQQVVWFLQSAQSLGRLDEARRVLDRLEPEALEPELALTVFDALLAYGLVGEAGSIIAAQLERNGDDPAVLWRASSFAQQQGRLDEAATTLERAMTITLEQQGMTLDELRASFAQLFDLRARLARPLGNDADARATALAEALAVADRWRFEDPDNAEVDRLCAQLLWSLDRDEEAWRHLSSSLDRHPADGATIAWVADALENNGDLERADALWTRAIAVEPTDPGHRLRRAQNLLATDREAEARELLDAIVDGDWQPRFWWTVDNAKRLLRALDDTN